MAGTARTKDRSPGYPAIDLADAIQKAQTVYENERRNAVDIKVLIEHWGYSSVNGRSLRIVSALKQFGLLSEEESKGGRALKLSTAAFNILIDSPDSPDRERLVREAALLPSIHRRLWDEFGGELPSTKALRVKLLREGFTENGVDRFIAEFRATIDFAGLGETDIIDGKAYEDESAPDDRGKGDQVTRIRPHELGTALRGVEPGMTAVSLPITDGPWPLLQAQFPISEASWNQMMTLLKTMKPALVKDRTQSLGEASPAEDDEDDASTEIA